jgi:uncharacterized lipoprotein
MNKIKWVMVLSLVLLLSACGNKDALKDYAAGQTKLLAASDAADAAFIALISKAKASKVPFRDLEAEVKHNRDVQEGIYASLQAAVVPTGAEAAKEGSMMYVNQKMTNYNDMIKVLSMQNYDLLDESVKQHGVLMAQYSAKALDDINLVLTKAGQAKATGFAGK